MFGIALVWNRRTLEIVGMGVTLTVTCCKTLIRVNDIGGLKPL